LIKNGMMKRWKKWWLSTWFKYRKKKTLF